VTLRKEVVKLNREMTNTSAQDDFAKWAKLRRQHDKKKAEYDQNGETKLRMPGLRRTLLTRLYSTIPQILPHKLRPHRLWTSMGWHFWRTLRHPVLVLQASSVLDPAGLGSLLRRVAVELPSRAAG